MNLGKLLGTGKSIISGEKPAAYREDKRFYLPQFVSPKNPFASPASPLSEPSKAPVPESMRPGSKLVPPPVKKGTLPAVAASGATARATTWVSKLNPASLFKTTSATVNKNVTPVQVELSLEKVKVVHNDLTDADVEIVPMKSRPARELPTAQTAKKSWADLGERIIKVTAL